jgi:hypothetical protein
MMKASEIYEAMVAVLPPQHIDHHFTDLYVKMTPETTKIIKQSGLTRGIGYTVFTDQITGTPWYDIAFAYTPEWERRLGK